MSRYAFSTNLDVSAEMLMLAYRNGFFPMGDPDSGNLLWFNPSPRSLIEFRDFHVPRRFARYLRNTDYRVTINSSFDLVIAQCARREQTWINETIIRLYCELYNAGNSHSVEVRDGDKLVGGLYGVAIGGAFFGESMFSLRPHASKIALVWLVDQLVKTGFSFLETQYMTDHLASFGAKEIPRLAYERMLETAVKSDADFRSQPPTSTASSVLQRISQISYR